MGVNDGRILSTTKVVDHGPNNLRWNLVIVGDGYQAAEINTYHTDVNNFITALRATPPFDQLFCGINVFRIDVESTDSGAFEPTQCGGPGTPKRTYFNSTFCSVGPGGVRLERLLTIDSALATNVVDARVPERHQILCIVNSSKYGGAGGNVAVCSTEASAAEIAIHEIGHSGFGLADEYGGNGTGTPVGEPTEPNVTRDTNRNTNKWRALILPGTPMPSACDMGCAASTCVPPGVPPGPNAVGTYEGAIYSDCNTYRPLPECKMRTLGQPFCPVCANVITNVLTPFLPLATINLVTPSLQFLNVPAGMGGIGVTTHRAIVWELVTCRNLTFRIIGGPSGGFGTPSGTQVTVNADIVPTTSARIWLSYTSTNPGDSANGTVTVECVETGQQWNINISANTIARPRSAVGLVLDRSGSMDEDAGDAVSKVSKLREAAENFVNILLPNDGIGLVRFNESADRLMDVTEAGAAPGGAGRAAALGQIQSNALQPNGATSIGDGVLKGRDLLNDAQSAPGPDYDVTAMIVLTDGMWNTPPSLASVNSSINANTYAIGLGLPSNISVPSLTTLCQGNNGYLLITGAITPDQSMRLSKYFLQILAGVSNAQIAADPSGVLTGEFFHRIPFFICEADYGMDVILLSPYPWALDFLLEAPDGTIIDPSAKGSGANLQFVMGRYSAYYRCALPLWPNDSEDARIGQWHAMLNVSKKAMSGQYGKRVVYYDDRKKPQVPYELVVHTYSSLTWKARLLQESYQPGSAMRIMAQLHAYDVPVTNAIRVWATVTAPDGNRFDVALRLQEDTGSYVAMKELWTPGVYQVRIRATGDTAYGIRYERESTYTAVIAGGKEQWDDEKGQEPSGLCQWLSCLHQNGVFTNDFIKKLEAAGIRWDRLQKCLKVHCSRAAGKERSDADILKSHDIDASKLLDLLNDWMRGQKG